MAACALSAQWDDLRLQPGCDAGSELDGSRLLSALEARPELLAGLQAELQTRDVAACIRQLASPLTGGGAHASQCQGGAIPAQVPSCRIEKYPLVAHSWAIWSGIGPLLGRNKLDLFCASARDPMPLNALFLLMCLAC